MLVAWWSKMREGTVQPNGAAIKRLRIERGLTQEALAEKIGCSKRTVENLEASKPVYVQSISEAAEALNVPLAEVIQFPGDESAVPHAPVAIGTAPELPALLIGRQSDV